MVAFLFIIGFVSVALLVLLPLVALAVVQRASAQVHGSHRAQAERKAGSLSPWALGGRMQPSQT